MRRYLLIVLTFFVLTSCLVSSDAQQSIQAAYGIPQWSDAIPDETLIEHTGYIVSFNSTTNLANYVVWTLTADRLVPAVTRNMARFEADNALPYQHRVNYKDYSGSGYDRGHLCPAADNTWRLQAMLDCFLMSNICPQKHVLNDGVWNDLEQACRRWAYQGDTLHIIAGPIVSAEHDYIGQEHCVAVPQKFFKVILRRHNGTDMALAFLFSNDNTNRRIPDHVISINEAQKITRLRFFPDYNGKNRESLFNNTAIQGWRFYK